MFGIYIHVPFCQKKCFYCDFYSIETLNLFGRYLDALCLEIEIKMKSLEYKTPKVDSIFIGGGTPSLLYPEQLDKIIRTLKFHFDIKPNAEWSLEANPGTLNFESLVKYRESGINRLSVGVQSFNDDELAFLQRIHTAKQAETSILDIRKVGFSNYSLDLIFSIPGQTMDKIEKTIDRTLMLNPNHISAYSLIYEPGTPLYEDFINGRINKIDDDFDADIYKYICETLIDSGYEQYEVSNFALPDNKCIHNINYWQGGEYLAFGPSGHGFFNGERYWNVRSLDLYYQYVKTDRLPLGGSEKLNKNDFINESVMLGLRSEGIDLKKFEEQFDLNLELIAGDLFYDWLSEGVCSYLDNKVKLNHKGYFICNTLVNQLIKLVDKHRD